MAESKTINYERPSNPNPLPVAARHRARLASSCKKNNTPEPEVQFPLSVKATTVVSQGQVRLFTSDGEVTDASVMARFIAGAEGFNENFEIEPTDIVTFHTDSTAEFESLTGIISVQAKQTNKLVFRYPFALENSDPLTWQFLLDRQLIAETNITHIVPPGTGFTHVGEAIQIASGNYQQFELPVTTYLLSRWRGQGEAAGSYYNNSVVFSPFSEKFLDTLRPRDTVAYQERLIRFSK